jgi:hypothetical protein
MHTAKINVLLLLCFARPHHIVPDISALLLISIGQLCDADCALLFLADIVSIGYKMLFQFKASGRAPTDCGILTCPDEIPRMDYLPSP